MRLMATIWLKGSSMKWYLAIEAWSLTQWYLQHAGVRGGGGALFTARGIRAANSRYLLYPGLVNLQGMSRVQTLRSTQTSRDNMH